jgi:hypothetical protein
VSVHVVTESDWQPSVSVEPEPLQHVELKALPAPEHDVEHWPAFTQ